MITELDTISMGDVSQLDKEELAVVMFYGATCGPCKASMPHFETVVGYYQSKGAPIKFYKYHVWETDERKVECKRDWEVTGVPNFKIIYKQKIITSREGGGDEKTIAKFVHDGIDEVFKQFGDRL